MKIPDHVLDLVLIGAIGAICLVPHATASPSPEPQAQRPAIAPGCMMPAQTPVDAPTGMPVVAEPAPPTQPIRAHHDPCPACGMG